MRVREPPANTSREAVALRKAAIAFTQHIGEPTVDDRKGMVLNRRLLAAARAYARRATARSRIPEATRPHGRGGAGDVRLRGFAAS
jgi:hypothetical protein